MKIIIPTKGVLERMHSVHLLKDLAARSKDIDVIVVPYREDARRVMDFLPSEIGVAIPPANVTDLVAKRNWICDELVEEGEWFIGMDDNVMGLTAVADECYSANFLPTTDEPAPDGYESWRKVYNGQVSPAKWMAKFRSDMKMADSMGAPLVGVATLENPFFRERKYSNYRFVKTKIFAMKNHKDLRFKYLTCHDSYLTMLAIAKYGKVLVNSYLHHKSKMYEKGGLGTREEREKKGLIRDLNKIIKEFPGLCRIGRGKNSALALSMMSEASVTKWRRENGYL